ncbi:acyl-CoA reductase-like NAD-dependent aldehyde dehydrogenase [Nocardia kruczakiae]|uniref:Acyl-CoA reductase-like NAD-dependent aldehyde dehydrogenase n=1 Tax=Nocardia kruczakiae TaxID=261477 RepID=A0ABU1XJW4_9NOCA|nr:acyl-CoA reductase-like NAD-dependent aldehyde dehydrogenase [Nocardia kruczakiae]
MPNTEPSPGESTAGKSTGANKPAARKTASRTAAEKTPAKAVKSAPAAKSSAPAAAKSAPAATVKEDPAPARQASAATAVVTDIEVRNPATGELVGTVPAESADAVAAKVRELRLYQPEWEAIGPEGRKEWLLKLQDWIIDHTDHLADVLQSETGKARVDALIDPSFSVDLTGYYARRAGKFLADDHPSPHSPLARVKKLTTAYRPYPVVGVITPWNFPLAMPVIDVIPALAAGAAVVLKPSEVTPLSALELARGWAEIGAPPVLAVVTGAGETGAAVVDNVDYVQFTGSTKTGKRIAAACVERLIPYSLELGGKDPAIVLADADIDRAAYGIAFGGLFNAGQVCISVERVYVEAPVYDTFVEKLAAHVRELRQGADGREPKYDVGALANDAQKSIVSDHVEDAIAKGARAVTGGKATGVGTFYQPTVLADVDHSMSCMTEETFGPTIPVMKVADEAEAVRLANDSIYGLSASVWTGDKARGERVARQLNAGAVNINDVFANMFSFALPMGGWQQSGVGARWGGADGVRKYCRKQAITVPILPTQEKELMWFPYNTTKLGFALAAMRAAGARGMRRLGIKDVLDTVGGKK